MVNNMVFDMVICSEADINGELTQRAHGIFRYFRSEGGGDLHPVARIKLGKSVIIEISDLQPLLLLQDEILVRVSQILFVRSNVEIGPSIAVLAKAHDQGNRLRFEKSVIVSNQPGQ